MIHRVCVSVSKWLLCEARFCLIYNLVLCDTKNITNDFLAPPQEVTHLVKSFFSSFFVMISLYGYAEYNTRHLFPLLWPLPHSGLSFNLWRQLLSRFIPVIYPRTVPLVFQRTPLPRSKIFNFHQNPTRYEYTKFLYMVEI
jgi:hypothetical protein